MATTLATKGVIVSLLIVVPAAIIYSRLQPEAAPVSRAAPIVEAQAPSAASNARHATAASITPWPLVVPEAELRCRELRGGPAPTVATSAGEFALTGHARAAGYAPIDAVWLDDDAMPGAKVPITAMVQAALALCEHQPNG